MGHLKNKTMEEKKQAIIDIYKFYFRFSFEKVNQFIDNPMLMVFILEYLKQTKMTRVYQRPTLKKNLKAYYKAMENMINVSQFKNASIELMPVICNQNEYDIRNS